VNWQILSAFAACDPAPWRVRLCKSDVRMLANRLIRSVGANWNQRVAGKNLWGPFHQPSLVFGRYKPFLGQATTRGFSLPGMVEVVKYGLLGEWPRSFDMARRKMPPRMAAVDMCAAGRSGATVGQMKAEHRALRDEKRHGDRALLNLGHTFLHALEAATGYSDRLFAREGVAYRVCEAFRAFGTLGLCLRRRIAKPT